MPDDRFDICACGCDREEHDGGGACQNNVRYHNPCLSFRLACTAEDIAAGYAEWKAMCAAEGRDI